MAKWGVVCGKTKPHKEPLSVLPPTGKWLQKVTSLVSTEVSLFDTRKEARAVAKRLTTRGCWYYHAKKYGD